MIRIIKNMKIKKLIITTILNKITLMKKKTLMNKLIDIINKIIKNMKIKQLILTSIYKIAIKI
jgi:hypothetical protein